MTEVFAKSMLIMSASAIVMQGLLIFVGLLATWLSTFNFVVVSGLGQSYEAAGSFAIAFALVTLVFSGPPFIFSLLFVGIEKLCDFIRRPKTHFTKGVEKQ